MSDKAWGNLNPLDRELRGAFPSGTFDGVRCTIEMVCGFEKFNTRPYHNYETWGDGYRISIPDRSIIVEREDLDDAVREFCAKIRHRNFLAMIVRANTTISTSRRLGNRVASEHL